MKGCNVVIADGYTHCYHHRNWPAGELAREIPKPKHKRYFCDACGTVSHALSYTDCKMCGHQTEALDGVIEAG